MGADAPPASDFPVIPAPVRLEPGTGRFRFGPDTAIRIAPWGLHFTPVVERELDQLRRATGLGLPIVSGHERAAIIVASTTLLPREGYSLLVEAERIRIEAADAPGVFHAFQTLRQLLPPAAGAAGAVCDLPSVEIRDRPRFRYRGLLLDVSRHFFEVSVVKRLIDLMARYKLNRFHWHLTNDQGWRIEIGRYPRLTEVGARRRETVLTGHLEPYRGDGIPHGGFYTQPEIREVVAYAAERFVTVIPEIGMPGHVTAALAAYPELGCREGSYEVTTTWGIQENIFCPSDATFRFLEGVLGEVLDLFPGQLIHLGGDEVPKEQWRRNAVAREIIEREELVDADELHGWFLGRMSEFLGGHGRRAIAWDEILQAPDLPESTAVMVWRGASHALRAAEFGHEVVMAPFEQTYLDFPQGDPETEPPGQWRPLPLETVYGFEPVPAALDEAKTKRILGAQGQLWTEYIATPEHLDYMAWPRAIALAEAVWSYCRDVEGFRRRLRANLAHLDALSVNYRKPD